MIGTYKLKLEMRIRVANSTAVYPRDQTVKLTQVDPEHNKILLEFSETEADWFHESFLMYLRSSND